MLKEPYITLIAVLWLLLETLLCSYLLEKNLLQNGEVAVWCVLLWVRLLKLSQHMRRAGY